MENFIDVVGYEGLYQISNLGNVKSLGNNKFRKEKILKNGKTNCGYKTVCLSRNSTYKTYTIHRLIALHFIENKMNKRTVNHINGIKIDNRVENLEWNTTSENTKHAYDNGLIKVSKAENHVNAKLSNKQVLQIRLIGRNLKQKQIAEIYGITQTNVSNVLNNKYYKI
jgi:predicted XRE-type DNA-binding protein